MGRCNRAGVKIIAGTDGPGIGSRLPGFGLHRELELLVESGLSPLQALRAASLTGAEALGKDDRLAAVEAGKFADMVVLDADPLQEIQNLRKIHLVVQDGKTYAPDALLSKHGHKLTSSHNSALIQRNDQLAKEPANLRVDCLN